jgi:hypothetical protein
MEEQMLALLAQREILLAQIAATVAKGSSANVAEVALLKAHRRMLMNINAQVVTLQNTPPEVEPIEE